MKINIVLPRATLFDIDDVFYPNAKEMLTSFNEKGHNLILMSHASAKHQELREKVKTATGIDVSFYTRTAVRAAFVDERAKPFLNTTVVIGSSDADLHLAANFKLLLINPGWSDIKEEKPVKYGVTIDDPKKIVQMVDIIANQQHWFFYLSIDEKTDLYALTSANNNSATSEEESVIIDGFRDFLKNGNRDTYYEALFFHFISGVMKSDDLRKIDIWGIMPSSGLTLNSDMLEIKERCRYLTNKGLTEPLFIRHTQVQKSHYTSFDERIAIGSSKHLKSINLNPFYRKKLRGKTVCILDDYVTNGTSFEALRNLLLNAGVARIIFVAIGRFKKWPNGIYQKEDYEISGDVFTPNYTFELISKDPNFGAYAKYDSKSKDEVKNIYDILNEC